MRAPEDLSLSTCLLAADRGEPLLPAGATLIAGVSGGADSMALLHLLHSHAPERQWKLLAAHLNHGLRGAESDADEALVAAYCAHAAIPLELARAALPRPATGLEAWGRKRRLEFFAALAGRRGAQRVVLAHHARDLAETMLLRLLRGCGPTGLVGMRLLTHLHGLRVVRPWLYLNADLAAYCRRHGVPFREDASNRDARFTRNRIRHELLPLLEAAAGGDLISRWVELSRLLAAEEDAWQQRLAPLLEEPPSASGLAGLPRALRLRLLYALLKEKRGAPDNRRALFALADKLADPEPQWSLDLGGGWRFVRRYEDWGFTRGPRRPEPEWIAVVDGWREAAGGWRIQAGRETLSDARAPDAWTAYLAPDCDDLGVRARRPGDRMRLMDGTLRRLKGLFAAARVPLEERRRWPVLVSGEEIVWVPGIARSALRLLPERGGPALVLRARRG